MNSVAKRGTDTEFVEGVFEAVDCLAQESVLLWASW